MFSDISHNHMEIYMDDFTTYGKTFEEALSKLEKTLQRCDDHNLSLNSEKCFMMMQEGVVLGHYLSQKGIQVDTTKIEVISNLPVPTKHKDVRSLLGHASYYRRFIKYFSKIAAPLYTLLTKDAELQWTNSCSKSFFELKEALTHALVHKGPKWELPFHIHIDASDHAIGVVLGQKETIVKHAIYLVSKNL